MPDGDLKLRLENIGGSIVTRPIDYVIDRDGKQWGRELKNQKRALKAELDILETFVENKVRRPGYVQALELGVIRDAQRKVNKIESDLKLREKCIEEMKIFAKME